MPELKTIYAFLAALPELLKLIQVLMDAAKEAKIQTRVGQDVRTIHVALSSNNPDSLNRLFNNRMSDPPKAGE